MQEEDIDFDKVEKEMMDNLDKIINAFKSLQPWQKNILKTMEEVSIATKN